MPISKSQRKVDRHQVCYWESVELGNAEQFDLIHRSVHSWNQFREDETSVSIDLSGMSLSDLTLAGINLSGADLRNADLTGADLRNARLDEARLEDVQFFDTDLRNASLNAANLQEAELYHTNLENTKLNLADFRKAHLENVKLTNAELLEANLTWTTLIDTDFTGSQFLFTVLGCTDLSRTTGLECIDHWGPSIVDLSTFQRSISVPAEFWRGCGLPEWLIALFKRPADGRGAINESTLDVANIISMHSCFISYSSADHEFATKLYNDLQSFGVRCWFDKHDLKIGDRIRDTIEHAIKTRDKLLLILSKDSINSSWVENEVELALHQERKSPKKRTILFPIQIDESLDDQNNSWLNLIRRERHIGDFRNWQNKSEYVSNFATLVNDLQK